MRPCPTGRCREFASCSDCAGATIATTIANSYPVVQVQRPVFFGRRLQETHPEGPEPGDYWLNPNDRIVDGPCWYVVDPAGKEGALRKHDVVEHHDGTITVDGAIVDDTSAWTLNRGVWWAERQEDAAHDA